MTSPAPRVLFWVQHLVGVGHQRRSAAIARALAGAGAQVCYVSGGRAIDNLDLSGCEFVQLPPVRSMDMQYHTLVDEHDQPIDDAFQVRRRTQLLTLLEAFAADVVITETWPFGRGLLRFELEPMMQAISTMRPRPVLISSIRDIVEHREQRAKFQKMAARVEQSFDWVLVHSDPQLVSFADSFPEIDRINEKIRYTGYVSTRAPVAQRALNRDGPVLVSAGGGFFGERLLRTAIQAQALCKDTSNIDTNRPWQIMVGPNLPQARFDALCAMAPPAVQVQRNRDDFHDLLEACAVSVSQGGYNTIVDLLALRVPAVVVPYEDQREHEQAIRARHLAKHDVLQMVSYSSLTATVLAKAIDLVLLSAAMPALNINLDGAQNSARLIMQAAASVRPHKMEKIGDEQGS